MASHIGNKEQSHNGFGFDGDHGPDQVAIGKTRSSGQPMLIPAETFINNQLMMSPHGFKVHQEIQLPEPFATAGAYPSAPTVIYDEEGFGVIGGKPWRMYILEGAGGPNPGSVWFGESDDGIEWPSLTELDRSVMQPGDSIFARFFCWYDPDGIFTVNGISYPWASIVPMLTSRGNGDATAYRAFYSLDGLIWETAVMQDNTLTGNAFTEITFDVAFPFAFVGKNDPAAPSFNSDRPRSFLNAPGGWFGISTYVQTTGNFVWTNTLVANNETDPANWNSIGDFANFRRKIVQDGQDGNLGQGDTAVLSYVLKVGEFYVGLGLLYYDVAGTPKQNCLALFISRDCLNFSCIGPLYDAGAVAFRNPNDSNAINDTNMNPTFYMYNRGVGNGGSVTPGSLAYDRSGKCFAGSKRVDGLRRHILRAYWVEGNGGNLLVGTI